MCEQGVPDVTPAELKAALTADDLAFFGEGVTLPAPHGPKSEATKVRSWYSGEGSFSLRFHSGLGISFESVVWTTREGIEAFIGELTAMLERADAGRSA